MAVKKSGKSKRKASKAKRPRKASTSSINHADESSGVGLSLADQARLNGKYEKYESIDECLKEIQRVKRFIVANLARTVLGMMKNAEKGTNAAGAKLLWELAEIDRLTSTVAAALETPQSPAGAADTPDSSAVEENDPTKAVLSFYKKLGMTPPKLKPPKPVEAVESEVTLESTM